MRTRNFVWVTFLLAFAATVSPAVAQGGDVLCPGTHSVTFSPGLRLTPGFVHLTRSTIYTPCVSVSDPTITYGITSGGGAFQASCLDLLAGPPSTTWIITWNTGETSEWLYSSSTQNVSGTIIQTQIGVIVAGKFAGSTAIGVLALAAPPVIQCLSPSGVTTSQGLATLTIF
ncbi:MAG TPA: hypothetical protein VMW27_02760 [Thermoanaerobaculia bacterium]|nr:hypothetical protein [Thermoanaerobaculia bacterium]